MDNNTEYNVGDVVEVTMGSTAVRWIEVEAIFEDVKGGLPGFTGTALYDTTDQLVQAPFEAFCYDARITRVIAPLGYEMACLEQL